MLWRACFGLALYRFTRANRTKSISLCSIEFGNRTQSNTIRRIEFDWVRFVRLNSICSEIELTESVVFDFELNPRTEFDWVRLSSIFERSIYYAGSTNSNVLFRFDVLVTPSQTLLFCNKHRWHMQIQDWSKSKKLKMTNKLYFFFWNRCSQHYKLCA